MKAQTSLLDELTVDLFAGGGGASTGIELALGRVVDIAINHDPAAILMHKTNHPWTEHIQTDIWDVDPVEVCRGRPVGLLWASPDCKHFSKAKGGKPVEKKIRGLAWIALRWAGTVRPRVIILENVEEFKTWGPIRLGRPIKSKAGQTFRKFISQFEDLGYTVEHRELVAADYGAPTIRKRFFLIARCDGRPIVWSEPTHGPGRSKPWRTAAEIIDWSLPCPSIFERDKPLAENTLRRIARGIQKFVVENPEPFILNYKFQNESESVKHPLSTITSVNNHYLVTPFLSQYHGYDDTARGQTLDKPLLTVDTSNRYALVSAFISKFYKTGTGQDVREPLHTITTSPGHFAEVRAFLIKYYGQGTGQAVTDPLDTVVSKDRFGLVTVRGEKYQIVDIGMRMLTPKELYRAQGFPDDYIIDRDYTGKCYPKSEQVARCGNSVCPPLAEALVRANMIASKTYITTMAQLSRMVAV